MSEKSDNQQPTSTYVVTHTMVHVHPEGTVISISPDEASRGFDARRLIDLGAIRPATADEADRAVPITSGSVLEVPQSTTQPDTRHEVTDATRPL